MNSLRMSSLIALRLSGRLRVIVAIEDSTFRSIRVKFMVCLRWCRSRRLFRLDVVFLDDLSPARFFGLDVAVEFGGVAGA